MKLISITLRNYRIHRDLTVEFDPSRTVIVGGNESGKSTLIEAAHHALFLRSKVTGEMAQSLTSQFHEGHPLVSLIFEVGGKRYTITKQFGGGTAASALLAEEGGATLRGDEAEEKVHRLCRAEEVSGGRGLIGRIRAQWAHLWVWQGSAGSDPVEAANQAQPRAKLCERLGQLEGGGVLASGLDNEVVQEVAERYRGIFKENGSPRSDSALAVTAAGLAQATVARAAAVVALAGLRSAVEEIDVSGKTIASCTTSLGTMQAELAGVKEKLVAVGSLRILESQQKHAASSAEAVYRELKKADEEIVACEVLLVTRTEQMAPALAAAERAVDEERNCNTRFTEALAAAASASQAHAAVADILELVSLCEQVERLKVEQVGLGGRWADICRLREEMKALRAQARECAVLTPADVTKLSGLEKARDQAAATLQAIATRIEVVAGARPVLLDG
ncbi:MAG: ATP-binding protein, partial [Planctomycetota bacterium]